MWKIAERNRVTGFLYADGRKIRNGNGEEILLTGWGLGNWLLPEGYMWLAEGDRFDRPQRMEQVICELTGDEYAKQFWKCFRKNFITEADIRALAELGYNSVRIPVNWRLFMEDTEDICWKEEGFQLLDQCIDWCEKYGVYAFIDLHGAPGGQTGANIDDSIDDVPRLFIDKNNWKKGIELWEKFAERYKDDWIIGGYDLLNEPLRPMDVDGVDYDYLLPELRRFYEEAITAIRKHDKRHMLSIEGHHWATDLSVFDRKYDNNMVIHFHRYGCQPDISAYKKYIDVSKKLNCPLWLGETGENINEWYTAMYPLAAELGIGFNLWTWKKMQCTNSPYSIKKPDGWEELLQYAVGGKHLGYNRARSILDNYLENIKIENCMANRNVTTAAFRESSCAVLGVDFDEFPGRKESYFSFEDHLNDTKYRQNTGMCIRNYQIRKQRNFAFDCGWDQYALELYTGEFACYSIYNANQEICIGFQFMDLESGTVQIYMEDTQVGEIILLGDNEIKYEEISGKGMLNRLRTEKCKIKVQINKGKMLLYKVFFQDIK